jgi:hypothetical protein
MNGSTSPIVELTEVQKSGGILSKKIMLGEDAPEDSSSRAHTTAAAGPASRLVAGWFRRHPARAHRAHRPYNDGVASACDLIDRVLLRCRGARP